MQKSKEQLALEFWQRIDTLIGDERPYVWVDSVGIKRATFQSAKTRGTMPLPKTIKDWSTKIGCSYEWLLKGAGSAFPDMSETKQAPAHSTVVDAGLTISTEIDRDKLEKAFFTTEQTLSAQHKVMSPDAKSEFIVMLYTALIDNSLQTFDNQLLKIAIYNVENELENTRRVMSPDKKTLLIIAIYTLYIGDAYNKEAIEQTTLELVRSAA
ncbi:hypothetical protein [Acinetobacter tandoii]